MRKKLEGKRKGISCVRPLVTLLAASIVLSDVPVPVHAFPTQDGRSAVEMTAIPNDVAQFPESYQAPLMARCSLMALRTSVRKAPTSCRPTMSRRSWVLSSK